MTFQAIQGDCIAEHDPAETGCSEDNDEEVAVDDDWGEENGVRTGRIEVSPGSVEVGPAWE